MDNSRFDRPILVKFIEMFDFFFHFWTKTWFYNYYKPCNMDVLTYCASVTAESDIIILTQRSLKKRKAYGHNNITTLIFIPDASMSKLFCFVQFYWRQDSTDLLTHTSFSDLMSNLIPLSLIHQMHLMDCNINNNKVDFWFYREARRIKSF